jgi:hypothetical protein
MRAGAVAVLAVALGGVSAGCDAQGKLSEQALVAQTVAGTRITVEYYRPVARGRAKLFGDVVTWGENWTPGANWATTIDVDHDVKIEGKLLPKGKYSIWAVVQPDTWTVAFHRRDHLFHTNRPDSTDEQLRLTVRPDSGPHTEVLTWDFPDVATSATTLRLRWGALVLALRIAIVAPSLRTLSSSAERAPFLGNYDVEILQPSPGGPTRRRVEIVALGDTLHWRDTDGPVEKRRDFVLVPSGEKAFLRARRAADGQMWPEPGAVVTFTVTNGRATGYEVELEDGSVASRAKRLP